ncbi:MAG: ATP-binding protein [Candidatus Promineofilum sp.]|nr:ATP-binding protein [Promineifilum sp.]
MILEPLTLPGATAYLSQLMDYVSWAAAAGGLPEAAAYRLSLAVDEIATNIVLHGYNSAGRSGNLTIWAETTADQLVVTLEDTGEPFDPRQVPQPSDLDRPLEERRDGGLGIFLALWGVDGFSYEQRGDRNRSQFIMEQPGIAAGRPDSR